jgi:co-chaperonin GroES (HSP10)
MEKKITVTNDSVFIIRDETKSETSSGLYIPDSGKKKPHTGTIYGVGALVEDKSIKAGKIGLFHDGVGYTIEYKGKEYLVVKGNDIIGID